MNIVLVQINNSFAGHDYFPLSAGVLQAYAEKFAAKGSGFSFMLPVFRRDGIDRLMGQIDGADVAGFSMYAWNAVISLELARRYKRANPESLIVFGGPQVPLHAESFLREHRYIDLVCHGEGEEVFLRILENAERRQWGSISSISYIENNDNFVSNPVSARMPDLSVLPSPYLAGTFDLLIQQRTEGQWLGLWETNRGCPFRCDFCEWGIKSFDKVCYFAESRVLAEIDWFAAHKVEFIFCCDANFGLHERDLRIAKAVAESHGKTGYPKAFSVQSSKNATENVYKIQKLLADKGLSKGVLLAMQSVYPDTLKAVHRANISLDAFNELHRRFKRDGMVTFTDLIIGLPEETYDSFADGAATLIERGQNNRIQFINLSILGNSAMGDPEYQRRYGMQTVETDIVNVHGRRDENDGGISEKQTLVIGTKTMPIDDWKKARVFAWVVSFLHFDKIMQIPVLVLCKTFGLRFRDIIDAFMSSSPDEFEVWGRIMNLFKDKAEEISRGGAEYCFSEENLGIWWPLDEFAFIDTVSGGRLDSFYTEAGVIIMNAIKNMGLDIDENIIHDSLKLNRCLMRVPMADTGGDLLLRYNVWEVWQAALVGDALPLQEGSWRYVLEDKSGAEALDPEQWCREVVWYGNKRGLYLNNCLPAGVTDE